MAPSSPSLSACHGAVLPIIERLHTSGASREYPPSGGVDAWWCPELPIDERIPESNSAMAGHTMTVECEGTPIPGVSWRVQDLETGTVVDQVVTDLDGVAGLDRLEEEQNRG